MREATDRNTGRRDLLDQYYAQQGIRDRQLHPGAIRHAVRDGIRGDGAHLYPAMPYTSYGLLTDSDTQALWAYFMNDVAAVEHRHLERNSIPVQPADINAGWNLLFRDTHRFVPDQAEVSNKIAARTSSTSWPLRGMPYAAQFPHAEKGDRTFAGAPLGTWYAPTSLPTDQRNRS